MALNLHFVSFLFILTITVVIVICVYKMITFAFINLIKKLISCTVQVIKFDKKLINTNHEAYLG